jgi:carboxyl-terminal processing protease
VAKFKKFSKQIFVISLLVCVLLSGFIGYLIGNKNLVLSKKNVPQLVKTDLGQPKDTNFDLFWEAYNKLKANYYGDIDPQKALYGAIEGAFASTGDPYTNFLSPDISKQFEGDLSGELEGIGIKIGVLDKYPAVIAPLENSPALKAGLKPKDLIVKIDDKDTTGMYLDEAVPLIRGKAGTTVKLTVLRQGETDPRVFEITREKISVKTVEVKYKDDVAIIELSEFGTDSKAEFISACEEINKKGTDKIVLDLRNNPGGLLDAAVDIASQIFPSDTTVVFEQGKSGKIEYKTSGEGLLKQKKIAVLVNGGSASAAEILAGAIKDHGRGKVIGEKTFGKGTVQQYEQLSGGSSVKITIAKWLTPNGQNIDKNGIVPDIEQKDADNALFSDDDPVVNRAISELK